jgi:hypothetical protein
VLISTDSCLSFAVSWCNLFSFFFFATECNTVVSGFSGVIESPNFPSDYPDGLDCTWNITAPRGNKINATFSHFELEDNFWFWRWRKNSRSCAYDYIEVQYCDECDFMLEMWNMKI